MSKIHHYFLAFIDEYLKGPERNKMVKDTFEKYWDKLVQLPASSTGKYHHFAENIIPYGLINHTMRVVYFVRQLVTEEMGDSPINWESDIGADALVAAFLHDLGKMDAGYDVEHGTNTLKYLPEEANEKVRDMCQSHMHYWSLHPANKVFDRIVAYGDYLASRRDIDIDGFGYITEDGRIRIMTARSIYALDLLKIFACYQIDFQEEEYDAGMIIAHAQEKGPNPVQRMPCCGHKIPPIEDLRPYLERKESLPCPCGKKGMYILRITNVEEKKDSEEAEK